MPLTLTSFRIVLAQIPVARLTDVTFRSVCVLLTVTLTRHQTALSIITVIADAFV